MTNVLITGAGGFIGQALVNALNERGNAYHVRTVSLRDDNWRDTDISGTDVIVHLAGIAHVRYRDSMAVDYMRVNRDLTLEFARKAKAQGAKRFVFLSSMIVYGDPAPAGETRIITPDTEPDPVNAYGMSKLMAEEGLGGLEDTDFSVTSIRPPTVYGKGCRGAYAAISAHYRKLPVFPALCGKRSVIYIGNLVSVIIRCIDGYQGAVICPQDDEYADTATLVSMVRAAHGLRTRTTHIFDPAIRLVGALAPVRKILGGIAYEKGAAFDGFIPTDEAIRRTEAE